MLSRYTLNKIRGDNLRDVQIGERSDGIPHDVAEDIGYHSRGTNPESIQRLRGAMDALGSLAAQSEEPVPMPDSIRSQMEELAEKHPTPEPTVLDGLIDRLRQR